MINRKELGSWLEGPPAQEGYTPGSALGLPADGAGSPAPFGRRVLSLFLDWGVCAAASWALFHYSSAAIMGLFVGVNILMLTLFGATPAQLLLGLRVKPVSGRAPMLLRAAVRTVLMCLIIPGLVWNRDRQPLHDVVAGTAVVRA